MTSSQTHTETETTSDAGTYAVHWHEIDSDDIHLSRVLIIDGYTTLADTANIIAIRNLPIGRMNAEHVVIIRITKLDGHHQ